MLSKTVSILTGIIYTLGFGTLGQSIPDKYIPALDRNNRRWIIINQQLHAGTGNPGQNIQGHIYQEQIVPSPREGRWVEREVGGGGKNVRLVLRTMLYYT